MIKPRRMLITEIIMFSHKFGLVIFIYQTQNYAGGFGHESLCSPLVILTLGKRECCSLIFPHRTFPVHLVN